MIEHKSDAMFCFIADYLRILINSCGRVIERDEILNEHINAAFLRAEELTFPPLGDIEDTYVVIVYKEVDCADDCDDIES